MSLRHALAPSHDASGIPLAGAFRLPQFDYPLDFAHLRLWEIAALFPQVIDAARMYRSLVIVRDPWSRFVSAVDQCLKNYCPHVRLETMHADRQVDVVENFVTDVLRPEWIRDGHFLVHFSPQSWFIRHGGGIIPDIILPMTGQDPLPQRVFDALGLPQVPVGHLNRSRLDLSHVLASPVVDRFIEAFYNVDREFFASMPTLTHLAERRLPVRTARCVATPELSCQT